MRRTPTAEPSNHAIGCAQDATISVDVAVIGAGIAGLWLANLLAAHGFAVAICDGNPPGGVQTAASQGIVHSGVKYALATTAGARGWLAQMPGRWRACLAGEGDVNLLGVEVVAEHMHLVSAGNAAQAQALLGGLALANGAAPAPAPNPPPFAPGLALELADFAVDVRSLIRRLAEPMRHRLLAAKVEPNALALGARGVDHIQILGRRLHANTYLFAAGVGNQMLAHRVGARRVALCERPLRQTCVRLGGQAPRVFAHVVGGAVQTQPELTITSHGRVLYVGGQVAVDGAARDEAAHIGVLRRLLAERLPGVDFTGATFDTLLVNRAEPLRGPRRDVSDAVVVRHQNCLFCWPMKLSLAPRLGDLVLAELANLAATRAPWPGNADAKLRYAAPPWADS